jgi:hypothetical protein
MAKTVVIKQSGDGKTDAAKNALVKAGGVSASQFVVAGGNEALGGLLDGFEDKSLPPIIKATGLNAGDIIVGEITDYSEFDDGKNIQTVFANLDLLRPVDGKLEKVGQRAAMPVGAVLQRALGAGEMNKADKPADIIERIGKAGYGKGTILAMRYTGKGKARDKMNAPHLWDIKVKKTDGSVTHNVDAKKR